MNVKITLEFSSVQEAQNALAKLGANTKDAPAPAAGKPATTGKLADSSPTASAPVPAPAAPAAPKYEESGIPELIKDRAAKNKVAVVALLAEFGAKKGTELKSEQYADFKAKIEKIEVPAEADLG